MDDIVKQAMAKWPRVPHCSGWLGLDARGRWWLRDEEAQALGPFASGVPGARGSLLEHDGLVAFIGRNYAADAQGQWFFQNGPQRVYVELQATPWIFRVAGAGQVATHTGVAAQVNDCFLDEAGRLYLDTDRGFGLVHTQDIVQASELVEGGTWKPQDVAAADLPGRFGYVMSPAARAAS